MSWRPRSPADHERGADREPRRCAGADREREADREGRRCVGADRAREPRPRGLLRRGCCVGSWMMIAMAARDGLHDESSVEPDWTPGFCKL